MNVSLTPKLEGFIKDKVESGNYGNSSEVVREALRLLQQEDAKKQAFLNAIQKGMDDIEAGRISTKTPKQIFQEVVAKRGQDIKNA